ncbi:MAG: IS66 family insertion sequence element accessory protein TnpB [Lachnospiraceae bacterium]|jgi:putative transposase|nr:IS66 family insertion sequence element accessory protein TnpB [Lachnospiraceae bacterium]MCH4063804.1 IS66 family insertion sequence element accessory protein TnpB [Lachnospiraceae bacterium]MCH4103473.1 IS66 family insertion sequence element accessory protein TnpB [Lachnospiraceae bacterium]MCI1310129.1 IS66 family insertion sequence element accessory protein TnpB [Lachnospiraceae bacterium]MCI1334583.1 IS66 family insertion sequence element accessory protein TnpB [Lachnospiraceae bacterium
MDSITHQVRNEYWKGIIAQCLARPEGVSAKQWMKDHNISEKSYYYWHRKLRKEVFELAKASCTAPVAAGILSSEVSFAELPGLDVSSGIPPSVHSAGGSDKPDAVITAGSFRIGLYNSASEDLIRKILAGVTYA